MTIPGDGLPLLRKLPFFAGFREEDMLLFEQRIQALSLPKGAVLFRAGEETDAFYFVLTGRLRLEDPAAPDKDVLFLGRGDALGDMGLLSRETRSHTAVLESTAEFLMLPKKDFEDVIAAAPHLALPISRFLSLRLLEARRRAASAGPTARLYALAGPASVEDRVVLAVNLGVALAEQTRRRVLLLDVLDPPQSGLFARALNLEPVRVGEHALRQEDLTNPEMLRRLCALHPSGLELMSLPRGLMEGKFAGVLYAFLSALRRSHDLIVLSVPDAAGAVARAAMGEADRWIQVERNAPAGEPATAELPIEPERRWTLRLEEGPPGPTGPGVFRIPWRATFTATRSPFLPPDATAAHRAVARLARKMGGVSVGLALGSGAALGYVTLGFLKRLEREGIFPDYIAGTSIGALIGSFYASGKTPDELVEIARSITKARLWYMTDLALPFPRSGLLYGWQVLRFLKSVLGEKTFADMEIPFHCVATDIMNGEEVVLRHGKVAEAVRASLSLPFYFQPAFLGGRYLVDGGLVNPVPVSTIAAMGADVLISVNITTRPAEKRSPGMRRRRVVRRPGLWKGPNIFEVMAKTLYIMQYGISQNSAAQAHVLLEPDLSAFTWADFHRADEIIAAGERYIEDALPKIKSHLPFFQDTCRVPLQRK